MPPLPSRPECSYAHRGDNELPGLLGRAAGGELNVIKVKEPLEGDRITYLFFPSDGKIEEEVVKLPILAHVDGVFASNAIVPTVAMMAGEIVDPSFFNDIAQLGRGDDS